MKFFIDTANVDEIRKANDMGVIAGVTTNPSLIAKEGRDYATVLKEIAEIVDGPISGEDLYRRLKERGILVRWWGDSPRIRDYVRITIGSMEQMETLVEELTALLEEL